MNKKNEIPVTYDEVKSNERLKVIAQNGNTGKHYMSKYEETHERSIKWGYDTGILENTSPLSQLDKVIEEVNETRLAIVSLMQGKQTYTNLKGKIVNTQDELKDGLGDIRQALNLTAKSLNLNVLNCWSDVMDVIEKRVENGKMVGEVFVKQEDLK